MFPPCNSGLPAAAKSRFREQLVTQVVLGILSDDLAPGLPRLNNKTRDNEPSAPTGPDFSGRRRTLPTPLASKKASRFGLVTIGDHPGPDASKLVIYCVYSAR